MLWAEPNLLFLLWARHAENTREREKRSERLANNVIETDPLLPGKYWTHKYEPPHTEEICQPILRKYFYASKIVVSLLIPVCPDLAAEGALGQCFVYSVNYRSGPSASVAAVASFEVFCPQIMSKLTPFLHPVTRKWSGLWQCDNTLQTRNIDTIHHTWVFRLVYIF